MNRAILKRSGKSGSGFTMVEIIIAITMMGILASVAILCFQSGITYASLQCATDQVTADLRYTCESARRDQVSYTVTFNVGGVSYGVVGLQRGRKPGDIHVDLADSPYHLSGLSLNLGGQTQITYDRGGFANPSGSIVLERDNKTTQIVVEENGQVHQL